MQLKIIQKSSFLVPNMCVSSTRNSNLIKLDLKSYPQYAYYEKIKFSIFYYI
jgi:hypothetical protein